ncbi:MAG: V-type ATPase subunit [Candidatus Krumholzibacteriales bacterium]
MNKLAVDYTYIAARLNAMEAELPDWSWYERLARADFSSLLQILSEFYRSFEEVDSIYSFGQALETEKAQYLELLSKLISDTTADRFLRSEYDFDNLVFFWKSDFLGAGSAEEGYNKCGLIEGDVLADAIENWSGVYLPDYLKDIFDYFETVAGRKDIDTAQILLERRKWEFLLEAAPSDYAVHYTRMRIDAINIKNFIRLKRTGLFGAGKERWIPGGQIDKLTLRALVSESEDQLYSYLSFSPYSRLTDNGLDSGTPLWKIEPALSAEIFNQVSQRRHSFFDITPVIYHLVNMNRNYTALRSIITGRINGLPEEIIFDLMEGFAPS